MDIATKDSGGSAALPYFLGWISLPLFALAVWYGGVWVIAGPILFYTIPVVLDAVSERDAESGARSREEFGPEIDRFRVVLLLWPFVQLAMLVFALYVTCVLRRHSLLEIVALYFFAGQITSTIGIVYAHELMHGRSRLQIFLADVLMAMALYAHFRTEHLFVHHRYVGTPRDTVTARFGESLYGFYARVLPGSLVSAWRIEAARLQQRGFPVWHYANPFWRYAGLEIAFLALAATVGGWLGVVLWIYQALVALLILEAVNYIEHYGLMRREIEPGRYEPLALHHSWNSSHKFTSYLLINLTRHPDHHYRPDYPYQLLSSYRTASAPQMPYSYPVMLACAFAPPVWRKMMHPRIRKWRERYGYASGG